MMRALTGVAAAVIEAWQELRIHKLRVLLSLVGVAIAVAALTGTVAIADIGKQALVEQYERDGRPALLATWVYSADENGTSAALETVRPAFDKVTEEFGITYASVRGSASLTGHHGERSADVYVQLVDPAFAPMHRTVLASGRWLSAADAENLSPAIVVNQNFMKKFRLTGTPLPTTVDLQDPTGRGAQATIIGVTAGSGRGEGPAGFMLPATYDHWFDGSPAVDATWEMWVPVDMADDLAPRIGAAMSAELPGYTADTSRNDYLAWGGVDDLDTVALVVSAISGVILLLGALSLLNVAVITIQQRVREIGIRRSFGATSGRVFFSVVMESIVATTFAGLIGVLIAIALVNGPWTATYLLEGIDDPPPFPLSAAAVGLGASLAVGALAGVLPALIAVRVRIIDAIRF